jgi:glutathione synthase/RimK-type ligase-like ATP-grasp enzyme
MKKAPTTLWITDPWDTLDHPNDTTLRLAEEGLSLGLPQFWCDVKSIRLEDSQVLATVQEIRKIDQGRKRDSFTLGLARNLDPGQFSMLHYRTDPPVDAAYLHPLQILALSLAKSPKAQLVNPLKVLLESNEKMEAAALRQGGL